MFSATKIATKTQHPLMQWDHEDCEACNYVGDDVCPYHQGEIAGAEWMAEIVYAIARDPEIATDLVQLIASRDDLKIKRG